MKSLVMFCSIFFAFALNGCKQNQCVYNVPQKIMSVRTGEDSIYTYWDYVLADSINRDCIDSAEVVKMLLKYIAMRQDENKLYKISLLNKIEDFDKGEDLSQPKSFFDNILIDVYFDTISYKTKEFIFYNSNHKEIYRGNNWIR